MEDSTLSSRYILGYNVSHGLYNKDLEQILIFTELIILKQWTDDHPRFVSATSTILFGIVYTNAANFVPSMTTNFVSYGLFVDRSLETTKSLIPTTKSI